MNESQTDLLKTRVTLIKELQTWYQQFETKETTERLGYLREICGELRAQCIEATFLVGGSLAFGMAEEQSDFDVVYVGDTHWYGSKKNHFCGLANLWPFMTERLTKMMGKKARVCKLWMNWECMTKLVREEMQNLTSPQQEFHSTTIARLYQLYYVNRPIDETLDPIIGEIDGLRKEIELIDEGLRIDNYVPRYYDRSFRKYHARLGRRNIPIPPFVLQKEKDLLELLKN